MPKVQTPVETYVPPPDIPVAAAPVAPVISAVTATPPTEPHVIAPPVVVAPPPRRRRRSPRFAGASFGWQGTTPSIPAPAIRAGIAKGRVLARVMIDEKGNVTEVIIVSADPPRHFDKAVVDALQDWKFKAEGEKYVGEIEVNFSLKD